MFWSTLRLVWLCFCPPPPTPPPPSIGRGEGRLELAPTAQGGFLAAPDAYLDAAGELHLFLPRIAAWGVPAVLFRLKRRGFSVVRAITEHEGVCLSARR